MCKQTFLNKMLGMEMFVSECMLCTSENSHVKLLAEKQNIIRFHSVCLFLVLLRLQGASCNICGLFSSIQSALLFELWSLGLCDNS